MAANPLYVESPVPALRFGVVTETYPPEVNGVAMTVHRIVEEMAARGHSVHLVRPRQGTGDDGFHGAVRSTLVRGVPIPGYDGLRFGLPASDVLRRQWEQERPDVLYVATEGLLGWSAVRTAERMGIPVVSGFHTNFHSYSRHYGFGILRGPIYKYLRSLHNRTACTLVPTDQLRHQLNGDFRNLQVIGRGVDNRLFAPQRRSEALRRNWGVAAQERVVLYVGRLAAEKNLPLAVQAFDAMRAVDPQLRFALVGDGPMFDELSTRRPDLIFCGTQRGAALAEHYASGDIFLFPSETETFGNVTLEAMASGLAVVAYDYAAANLYIRDGENGLLAPLGEGASFIARATELATDPERVAALRSAARDKAETLDWRRVMDGFERLLFDCSGGGYGDDASRQG